MAVKPLLPHQPVTTTGLRPSNELLEALQIVQREISTAEWGRITGDIADQTDLQAALNGKAADTLFTAVLRGLVPPSGGGTTNFLRSDGTFAAPAGTDLSYTAATRLLSSSTGADVTLPLVTATDAGLAKPVTAPVTKSADFTLSDSETWIINNKAGADCVVTLPAAASHAGRAVTLKTVVGFAIVSVASDVVPLAGGAAGTAIVPAVAGSWATIVSDGSNWIIMAG